MKTVFTYGSLMFPQVWNSIVRQDYLGYAAELPDFQRKQVKNAEFPAIVARNGAHVSGIAYVGVNGPDVKRLDEFEGEIYARERVTIWIGGIEQEAQAYVLKAKYRRLLSRRDWNPDLFAKQGMRPFLRRTLGLR